jgi:hypothetical protein
MRNQESSGSKIEKVQPPTQTEERTTCSYGSIHLHHDPRWSHFSLSTICETLLQHLTENSHVIECLQSDHRALQKDGTVVFLELPHPRETFSMVECIRCGSKVPLELASNDDEEEELSGGELSIIWGDEGDRFDPVTQVRQFTIKMELTGTTQTDDDNNNINNIKAVKRSFSLLVARCKRMRRLFQLKVWRGCLKSQAIYMYMVHTVFMFKDSDEPLSKRASSRVKVSKC